MSSVYSFRNEDIVKIPANGCSRCLLLSVDHHLSFSSYKTLEQIIKLTVSVDWGENRSTRKSWHGFVRNS